MAKKISDSFIKNMVKGINSFIDIEPIDLQYSNMVIKSNPNCQVHVFKNEKKSSKFNNTNAINVVYKNINYQIKKILTKTNLQSTLIRIDYQNIDSFFNQCYDANLYNLLKMRIIIEMSGEFIFKDKNRSNKFFSFFVNNNYDVYSLDNKDMRIYKIDFNNLNEYSNLEQTTFYCVNKKLTSSYCLFLHSSFIGGAERSAFDLVNLLSQKYGAVSTVILPTEGPLVGWFRGIGVPVIVINYRWWCYDGSLVNWEILFQEGLRNIFEIKDLFIKINPDIIMTQTIVIPWGMISSIILNKPHIWNVREFGEKDHGYNFYYPFKEVLNMINKSSSYITTCGREVKNVLFPNLDDNKINIAYSHIKLDKNIKLNIKTSRLNNSISLVIPGMIVQSKGQIEAVKAIDELVNKRHYKNIELLIIGSMNSVYVNEIKSFIIKKGLSKFIIIRGFQDNISEVIYNSDIVLICSRMEAFSRIPVEALLLEKPIIASCSGGNIEIIKDAVNGYLYKQGDYYDLADKIEYYLLNPDEISVMGKRGPEIVNLLISNNYAEDIIYKASLRIKDNKQIDTNKVLIGLLNTHANLFEYNMHTLFVETKSGFNENEKHQQLFQIQKNMKFNISFDISHYLKIRQIRFDPVEGRLCQIKLSEVSYVMKHGEKIKQDLSKIETNGNLIENNIINFNTIDPHIIFNVGGEIEQVLFKGEIKISPLCEYIEQSRLGLEQSRIEVEQSRIEVEQSRIELEHVYKSASWKLTRPMRKVMFFLRKVKNLIN